MGGGGGASGVLFSQFFYLFFYIYFSLSPSHTAPVHLQGALLCTLCFCFVLTAHRSGCYSQKIRGYSPECSGLTTRLLSIGPGGIPEASWGPPGGGGLLAAELEQLRSELLALQSSDGQLVGLVEELYAEAQHRAALVESLQEELHR